MKTCYYCNEILNGDNSSKEHIFPQSVGGVLTSYSILCKECNNKLGHTIDAKFSKEIESFLVLSDKKQSKKYINVGPNLIIDTSGQIKLKNPVVEHERIDIDKAHFNIQARSVDEAREILEKLKERYYPKLDIDKTLNEMAPPSKDPEIVKIPVSVSSTAILNEISKIAINFYLMKNYNKSSILKPIELLKNGDTREVSKPFYLNKSIIFNSDRDCCHHIILIGSCSENILFAYVELYSCLKYVVVLNDSYEGEEILESYSLNYKTGQELKPKFQFNLKRDDIVSDMGANLEECFNIASNSCLNQLGNMLGTKKFHQEMKDKIGVIVDDVFSKKEELGIEYSEDLFQHLWPQMQEMLMPYIVNASKSSRKEMDDYTAWENQESNRND